AEHHVPFGRRQEAETGLLQLALHIRVELARGEPRAFHGRGDGFHGHEHAGPAPERRAGGVALAGPTPPGGEQGEPAQHREAEKDTAEIGRRMHVWSHGSPLEDRKPVSWYPRGAWRHPGGGLASPAARSSIPWILSTSAPV